MMKAGGARRMAIAAMFGLVLAGPAPANSDVAASPAAPSYAAPAPAGYLTAAQRPDIAAILGPPPPAGSGAKAGDIATYQSSRALQGTPRWDLAIRDAAYGPAAIMADFSCALGVQLTPARAPKLFLLLSRLQSDSDESERLAKRTFQRIRPFVDNGGTICVAPEDWLKKSFSYPSGHSTYGWATAMILAEIAPERGTAILARGRAFGESRVVCGVHYQSDVQAGRLAAAAVYAVLQSSPEFRADLEQTRAEITALRGGTQTGLDEAACKIEADAAAHPIW